MDIVASPRNTLSRLLACMKPVHAIGLLFASWMGAPAAADQGLHHLSGSEIHERIVGHEVGDDVHWDDRLFPDGSVAGYVWGDPNPGEWRITADQLCITRWVAVPEQRCFDVWLDGDDVQLRDGETILATGHVSALKKRKPEGPLAEPATDRFHRR